MLQDHVAATFGAGLGYACVVDVGDQKTSVSCVEDGISHRNTRVTHIIETQSNITVLKKILLEKLKFAPVSQVVPTYGKQNSRTKLRNTEKRFLCLSENRLVISGAYGIWWW
jgi:actin-related protein